MDVLHFLLENEPPEKRVRTWLEQCNFAGANFENEDQVLKQETKSHQRYFSSKLRDNDKINDKAKVMVSKSRSKETDDSDSDCLAISPNGRPYSVEESQKIINYIVENDVFPFIKGNTLWKRIETEKVCSRSWQSMKSQFISKIYPRIGSFSVQEENKEKFDQYMKPSNQTGKKYLHLEPGQRGWRKNGNYYTESEDIVILKYILQRHRYLQVQGNSLWQAMEERRVLPARSWQSMRSRYVNTIRHSLEKYKLPTSDIEKLKNGANNKDDFKMLYPHSPHSNQRTILAKKEQQNIRKCAVVTGIKLASNMKKSKEVEKAMRSHKKKDQSSAPSVLNLETGGSRTQARVLNNSLKRNAKNDDLTGSGTLVYDKNNSCMGDSNYISCTSGKKVQACIEENSTMRKLESDNETSGNGTNLCIENNSATENSICACETSEEKVQAHVEENFCISNLENVSNTCVSGTQVSDKNNSSTGKTNCASDTSGERIHTHVEENSITSNECAGDTSGNGTQVSVGNNSLQNSKCASDITVNEQTHVENYSPLGRSKVDRDTSGFKIQECVKNNSPKKNLTNDGATLVKDIQDDIESNPPTTESKCASDICGSGSQCYVENNLSQKESENSENYNIALKDMYKTPCLGPISQENGVCTENVDKNCGEIKISAGAEEEEKEMLSDVEDKNKTQVLKSESEG